MTTEQLQKGKELEEKINHYSSKIGNLQKGGRQVMVQFVFADNFNFANRTTLNIEEIDIELGLDVYDLIKKFYTDKLNKLQKEFTCLGMDMTLKPKQLILEVVCELCYNLQKYTDTPLYEVKKILQAGGIIPLKRINTPIPDELRIQIIGLT